MNIASIKMRHSGKNYISISCSDIEARVAIAEICSFLEVSRITVLRWVNCSQCPPRSALKLLAIRYLGFVPWPGFEDIRAIESLDQNNARAWGFIGNQWPNKLLITIDKLNFYASDLQQAYGLQLQVSSLRQTINELTTRQTPSLPCAEIIPISHYLNSQSQS